MVAYKAAFFTAKKKKTYSYNKRKKEFLRILRKMKNQKSINKIRPKKKTSRGRSSQVNTAVAGTSWYKQIQIPWYMYVGIQYDQLKFVQGSPISLKNHQTSQ